ncbi:non-lysosomal glucosylceramidase-like isoform X1 [Watersipora subatra]|uniref:non-lysosomal glucosylceramidase-like isoform X1 n=2 Tax=Watersipora subatra TaxID=2589382 RepID=UPI00355BFCAD
MAANETSDKSESTLEHLAENVAGRGCLDHIPQHGFRVALNHRFSKKGKPFKTPRIHQLPSFIGLSLRYIKTWNKIRRQGKKMFIDIRDAVPLQQIYGVPLGGIGCGSIGRGFKGEFGRFQMIPGMYKWKTIPTDQFIVCIRSNGKTLYQNVLSSHKSPKNHLKAWKWQFDGANATYHGLYPRSWTTYYIPELKVRLICRQISPIIPHEYKDSSLPVGLFVWTIENSSEQDLDISIVFTFQSGIGRRKVDNAGGMWNERFSYSPEPAGQTISGIGIHQKLNEMNCTYLLAAKQTESAKVSQCLYFDPHGTGADLWNELAENGHFSSDLDRSEPTAAGKKSAAAICVESYVKSGTTAQAEMCLAWHMPQIQFGAKEQFYRRRYARWFSGDEAGKELCAYALASYPSWEKQIEEWQGTVLNSSLPSWYKSAIFNELYFVSDGGSVWLDKLTDNSDVEVHANELINEYGQFAYLEGHEYRMYNTYDVHFYASFALIMNWPKLQLSLQYDVAHAINTANDRIISYIMDGKTAPIKEEHCVPHDLGDPEDEPWSNINSYTIHPTADWKDLNPKFVLQVMRDYHITKDREYLSDMFPVVLTVMNKSMQFDTDNDGMIENSGYADQTYDSWTATGTSAYCGGLWLAANRATIEMCRILDKTEHIEHFQQILNRASKAFDEKLWNGKYYNYDSSKSSHHEHIMSDQLCGNWYLKSCGITDEQVFPSAKVNSALRTIYENNVLGFGGGQMGAINGCKPDGRADRTTVQSEEFWTGVSYALSANFLQEGMLSEAFQTSHGVYREVYEQRGLGYQTPEAYMDNEIYRSLGYMRPLCIWSIQWAIEQYHKELLTGTKIVEQLKQLASEASLGARLENGSATESDSSSEQTQAIVTSGSKDSQASDGLVLAIDKPCIDSSPSDAVISQRVDSPTPNSNSTEAEE